ncbi:MAG: hypothetical protein ACD_60C00005G0001 [uncultured bacterium]|nr:MAG: hypothetical protein ACD_60C00005G0001 [uncultured bacterium]
MLHKNQYDWADRLPYFLKTIEDPWYQTVAMIQDQISILSHKFFEKNKIKTLHLPITTGSISSPMGLGSDSKPVEIELFGVKTYLADSMQFMLEYGCRIFKEGCYYLMPSFRGENADERHLCQFYHSEAEIPGNLDNVIKLVNSYIQFLSAGLLETCSFAIKKFAGSITHLEKAAQNNYIQKITFNEAIKVLEKYSSHHNLSPDHFYKVIHPDTRALTHLGEKTLIEIYQGMIWVTHYDQLSVPFYQAISTSPPNKAMNADLLFGIGEVIGAGERHTNTPELLNALKRHAVPPKEYQWYIELKEKYPLKTAGFGMGVERFILWVLNHNDIRDCQLFPRINGKDIVP